MHKAISFDEAEAQMIVHTTSNIRLKMVPYDYLKDIKLRSGRSKDLTDVARLEELRSKKNK